MSYRQSGACPGLVLKLVGTSNIPVQKLEFFGFKDILHKIFFWLDVFSTDWGHYLFSSKNFGLWVWTMLMN